jgi:hypothetical protein
MAPIRLVGLRLQRVVSRWASRLSRWEMVFSVTMTSATKPESVTVKAEGFALATASEPDPDSTIIRIFETRTWSIPLPDSTSVISRFPETAQG